MTRRRAAVGHLLPHLPVRGDPPRRPVDCAVLDDPALLLCRVVVAVVSDIWILQTPEPRPRATLLSAVRMRSARGWLRRVLLTTIDKPFFVLSALWVPAFAVVRRVPRLDDFPRPLTTVCVGARPSCELASDTPARVSRGVLYGMLLATKA